MREREKNVGRADHNPSQRNDEQGEHPTVGDSAGWGSEASGGSTIDKTSGV